MANLLLATSLQANCATNAIFRAWGQNVSTALSSSGWVNTSDTGQINWATVASPTGTGNSVGYEIWRMSDALQSTAPCFLKLEFGSSSTQNNPGLWITISSSTDGAGNLMGNPTTRTLLQGTGAGAVAPAYFVGANSRFALAMNFGSTTTMMGLGIERTHDANGNDTDEGILLGLRGTSASWFQQYFNCITGASGGEATAGCFPPANTSMFGTNGNQTMLFPIFHSKGIYTNPFMSFLTGFEVGFSAFSTIQVPYYGATRTYLPLGGDASVTATRSRTLTMILRWE